MKTQSGFTLVEIMVALVVLAIGLMGTLSMSTVAFRASRDNDQWTTARMVASNQLESLTSQTIMQLQNYPMTGSVLVYANGTQYTVSWQNAWLGPIGGPLRVTVWATYPGALAPVSVSTVKTFYL